MPGADVEAELPVTVEELLRGGHRRISLDGRNLEVDVPVGARDGTILRLAGQASAVSTAAPGRSLPARAAAAAPTLSRGRRRPRDGPADLAVAGGAGRGRDHRHSGRAGDLDGAAGTQSGRRLRLRGRGLPRSNGSRGDLYAVVRIVVPERPSPAERQAYEALKGAAAVTADRPARA